MNDGPWLMLLLTILVLGSVVTFATCQEQKRADCYERSCTVGYPEYIRSKCMCIVGEMKD